jgi:hypothetical protein
MNYVTVPIELTEVESRLIFNFTSRQIVCFCIGAAIGIPLFLATRGFLGTNVAMVLVIITAVPAFLFAVYKKDGIPLEKFLLHIIRQKYFFPQKRQYKALTEHGRKRMEDYKNAKRTAKAYATKATATGGSPVRNHSGTRSEQE